MRIVSAFAISASFACFKCGHAFIASPTRQRQLWATRRNAQLVDLSEAKSGQEATHVLSNLATDGKVKLWNSARVLGGDRRVTKIELKMKTRIAGNVRSKIGSGSREVTDRFEAGLGVVLIMSTALALTAQASLPSSLGLVRFLIVLALVFAPYGFLVLGLNLPQELNRNLVAIQRYFVPTFRRRQVIHEAGHFLVGYLLGVPIADYSVNSAVNAVQFFPLADPSQGAERARQMGFDAPMLSSQQDSEAQPPQEVISWAERIQRDREASDQLPAKDDTRRVWPFRGIDHDSLDRLAIISLAGVMSELIEFGDGLGGFADLQQLRGFLNAASVLPVLMEVCECVFFRYNDCSDDFRGLLSLLLFIHSQNWTRQRVPHTVGVGSVGNFASITRRCIVRPR